jgi:HEAT repeat protein
MKTRPSDSTQTLLNSLYRKPEFWKNLFQADSQIAILTQIAAANEPAAIPDLLPLLLTTNAHMAIACAQTIDHLLKQIPASDFFSVYGFASENYSYWGEHNKPWFYIRPADLVYLSSFGPSSISVIGLASCHANGFVREAAVRWLGDLRTGQELPFLLLRANDWVENIRRLAMQLILDRMQPSYVPHFLSWISLILRLKEAQRLKSTQIVESVEKLFLAAPATPYLHAGFQSPNLRIRRYFFNLALDSDRADSSVILQKAFAQADGLVRFAAAQSLRRDALAEFIPAFLTLARNDAFAAVRRTALRMYIEKYPEAAPSEVAAALLDSNISIREEAQTFLAKSLPMNLRDFYKSAIRNSTGKRLACALSGLGEIGDATDAQAIEPFLSKDSPRVQAAALRSLARLDPKHYLELFMSSLQSPHACIVREALGGLRKNVRSLDALHLWNAFNLCSHAAGKRAILSLLSRASKWESIHYLLQLLSHADEQMVEIAQRHILRWYTTYNRSYVTPTIAQQAAFQNSLQRNGHLLPKNLRPQFESLLKTSSNLTTQN